MLGFRETGNPSSRSERHERACSDNERSVKKNLATQNIIDSEDRIQQKQWAYQHYQEEAERLQIDAMLHSQQETERQHIRAQQESELASELRHLKHEKLCDEKIRQQIRYESDELRALEAKLKSAYVAKERALQISQHQATARQEAEEEFIYSARIQREQEANKRAEEKAITAKVEAAKELQSNIQQQLIDRKRDQEYAYHQFLIEKQMIDDVVKKIFAEDVRIREEEFNKKQEQRQAFEEFRQHQMQWNEAEKRRIEQENQNIKRYAEQQERRSSERAHKHREDNLAKARVQNNLLFQLQENKRQAEEFDNDRLELAVAEMDEKERLKEIAEFERKLRAKLELQRNNELALQQHEEGIVAEQAEKEIYKQQMIAKLAEDERIEKMDSQKRRAKQLEHREAVEQLLKDRKETYQAEVEREMFERKLKLEMDKQRAQLVEEERQKMLAEHAHKLLGYIPKGVLEEDDLIRLGNEFVDYYKPTSREEFEAKHFENY